MFVYLITNTANGKYYVGQHSGGDINKYLRKKSVYAKQNSGIPLHRAILKYGIDNFIIEPIAYPIDKDQMDALEIFFIAWLDSQNPDNGYNITAGGGGQLGFRLSESAKHKIRQSKFKLPNNGMTLKCQLAKLKAFETYVCSDETKKKMSLSGKGKYKSEEWKNKIGDAQRNRPLTEEHKRALKLGWAKRRERLQRVGR